MLSRILIPILSILNGNTFYSKFDIPNHGMCGASVYGTVESAINLQQINIRCRDHVYIRQRSPVDRYSGHSADVIFFKIGISLIMCGYGNFGYSRTDEKITSMRV